MKIKCIVSLLIALGFLAGSLAGCTTGKQSESKLEAGAKITRSQAEKIALAKVPGGTIKEGEIEEEKGKVIWSFDIATPGTKDITEVQVDANTGDIVSTAKETPKEQEAEKKK